MIFSCQRSANHSDKPASVTYKTVRFVNTASNERRLFLLIPLLRSRGYQQTESDQAALVSEVNEHQSLQGCDRLEPHRGVHLSDEVSIHVPEFHIRQRQHRRSVHVPALIE